MLKANSYYGIITAVDGLLIGGVKEHKSSRFELRESAETWLKVVIRSNKENNRCPDEGEIRESILEPEIKETEWR